MARRVRTPGSLASPQRRALLRAAGCAAAPALVGCSRERDNVVRFWAMGREGEVVA